MNRRPAAILRCGRLRARAMHRLRQPTEVPASSRHGGATFSGLLMEGIESPRGETQLALTPST
jgi:hypothetical protein